MKGAIVCTSTVSAALLASRYCRSPPSSGNSLHPGPNVTTKAGSWPVKATVFGSCSAFAIGEHCACFGVRVVLFCRRRWQLYIVKRRLQQGAHFAVGVGHRTAAENEVATAWPIGKCRPPHALISFVRCLKIRPWPSIACHGWPLGDGALRLFALQPFQFVLTFRFFPIDQRLEARARLSDIRHRLAFVSCAAPETPNETFAPFWNWKVPSPLGSTVKKLSNPGPGERDTDHRPLSCGRRSPRVARAPGRRSCVGFVDHARPPVLPRAAASPGKIFPEIRPDQKNRPRAGSKTIAGPIQARLRVRRVAKSSGCNLDSKHSSRISAQPSTIPRESESGRYHASFFPSARPWKKATVPRRRTVSSSTELSHAYGVLHLQLRHVALRSSPVRAAKIAAVGGASATLELWKSTNSSGKRARRPRG